MTTPVTGGPNRNTGLPPGVELGPLPARILAYVVDLLLPAAVGAAVALLLPRLSGTLALVLPAVGGLLVLGWTVLAWAMLARRAATPGMRALRLQLVGFLNGRPIGWGRVALRALVWFGLSLTGVGLVVMLVLMVLHPRRQGWHDLAAGAVLIKQRVLAPAVGSTSEAAPALTPSTAAPRIATGQTPPQVLAAPAGSSYAPAPSPQQSGVGVAAPVDAPLRSPFSPPVAPGPVPQPAALVPLAPPAAAPPMPLVPPPGYPATASTYAAPADLFRPPAPVPSAPAPSVPVPSAPATPTEHESAPTSVSPAVGSTPLPAPAAPSWVAVLDDGREIEISELVLLGRNPQPQPGEEDARLIKLADETRTVSKSHLGIGLDAVGPYVVDRGSTNGSTITSAEGVSTRCRPGEPVYVEDGAIVSLGDHWLEIRSELASPTG